METYKRKLRFLLVLTGLLLLVYIVTFVVSNNSVDKYTWLDSRYAALADRIEIWGAAGVLNLARKNNIWAITLYGAELPVKQIRVEELFAALSRGGNFPVRSASAGLPERYGLGEDSFRIIVRGGAGLPLLDLHIGYIDMTGGEIYLRKAGKNEVRSGADSFSVFTDSNIDYWLDLRLFPDLTPVMIQKIHFSSVISSVNNENIVIQTFSRSRNGWVNENNGSVFLEGESFLRSILDSQAEGFIDAEYFPVEKSIIFELGDGSIKTMFLGYPGIDNARPVKISGSPLTYSLAQWTVKRLFPD